MTTLLALAAAVSLPAAAHDYPPAGVANVQKTCIQRKDIPPSDINAYCDCYVDLLQRTVSWREYLLLDSAVATKGLAALDTSEKAILGRALQATFYCSQKSQWHDVPAASDPPR